VFWILFISMAGVVLARVVDPVMAQQVVGIITDEKCFHSLNPSPLFFPTTNLLVRPVQDCYYRM
jgi:hypothetical protein